MRYTKNQLHHHHRHHRRDNNTLSTKALLSTGIYKLQNFFTPFLSFHRFPFVCVLAHMLTISFACSLVISHCASYCHCLVVVVIRFGYTLFQKEETPNQAKPNWTLIELVQVGRFYLLNVFWLGISTNFVHNTYKIGVFCTPNTMEYMGKYS